MKKFELCSCFLQVVTFPLCPLQARVHKYLSGSQISILAHTTYRVPKNKNLSAFCRQYPVETIVDCWVPSWSRDSTHFFLSEPNTHPIVRLWTIWAHMFFDPFPSLDKEQRSERRVRMLPVPLCEYDPRCSPQRGLGAQRRCLPLPG